MAKYGLGNKPYLMVAYDKAGEYFASQEGNIDTVLYAAFTSVRLNPNTSAIIYSFVDRSWPEGRDILEVTYKGGKTCFRDIR